MIELGQTVFFGALAIVGLVLALLAAGWTVRLCLRMLGPPMAGLNAKIDLLEANRRQAKGIAAPPGEAAAELARLAANVDRLVTAIPSTSPLDPARR